MYILACQEKISVVNTCPSGWVKLEYSQPFDPSSIDAQLAVQYMGLGFLIPVIPLTAALGVAILLKMIKG